MTNPKKKQEEPKWDILSFARKYIIFISCKHTYWLLLHSKYLIS